MPKPTFTIIGTGFIFPRHINAIQAVGGEVVDIINDFGGRSVDWIRVLLTTQAKYVVILTPNILHFDMTFIARRMNKIVLCEKPLTINSNQARVLAEMDDVYVVLQLRHHPLVAEMQEQIKKAVGKIKVDMDIAMHRPPEYFESWKGKKALSGGLLFNLGIHYFDLLLYLFGSAKKVQMDYDDGRLATGTIEGAKYTCKWRLSAAENKESQRRTFVVSTGKEKKEYNFSSKDNLSFEDLHIAVYRDLLAGKGVSPQEALKSIELVEKLYASKET